MKLLQQLSPEEDSKTYSKFFYQTAAIPEINTPITKLSENDFKVKREEINLLLTDKYSLIKDGYYRNKDGSFYVSALTQMPGVTVEMLHWWFWWHCQEPLRYKLWFPKMHYNVQYKYKGDFFDLNKTHYEKLCNSAHFVTEDIGTGPEKLVIKFMSPNDFGFDLSTKKNDYGTAICARVGSASRKVWFTDMCHFVKKNHEGVEMRSLFWIGNNIQSMSKTLNFINLFANLPFIKKKAIPSNTGAKMFEHCTQEYYNLASFLPALYTQER